MAFRQCFVFETPEVTKIVLPKVLQNLKEGAVTTIYWCCFRVSRSMSFDGGRRPCYGNVLCFRVRVLSINEDSLFLFKGAISLSISF